MDQNIAHPGEVDKDEFFFAYSEELQVQYDSSGESSPTIAHDEPDSKGAHKPMTYTEVIQEIKSQLSQHFPSVTVTIDDHAETGDTFVLVNNANIYDSSTFRRFRARIMEDVVWPNGLTNLYIACHDPASDTEDLQGHIRLTEVMFSTDRESNEEHHYEFGYHTEDVYRVSFPSNLFEKP